MIKNYTTRFITRPMHSRAGGVYSVAHFLAHLKAEKKRINYYLIDDYVRDQELSVEKSEGNVAHLSHT